MALQTCPNASWQRLLIVHGRHTEADYFNNIRSWSGEQAGTYICQNLAPVWRASSAFAGLGLLTLLLVVAWRVYVCVKTGCCCSRGSKAQPGNTPAAHKLRSTPTARWVLKGLVLACALTALALTVYGMTQAKKDIVTDAWGHVRLATDYTAALSAKLVTLADNVAAAVPVMQRVDKSIADTKQALGPLDATLDQALADLSAAAKQASVDISDIVRDVRQASADVDREITQRIVTTERDQYDTTTRAGQVYYAVTMTVLILGLVLLLVFTAVIFLNRPSLLCAATLLLNVWLVLYFLGALVMALGVGTGHDVCPAVESVVLYNVRARPELSRWAPMAAYYLDPALDTSLTLTQALKRSDVVDLSEVDQTLDGISAVVNNAVVTLLAEVSQGLGVAPLQQLQADVNRVVTGVSFAKSDLENHADRLHVRPVYLDIKSYGCCDITGQLAGLYNAFTGAGWVMLVAVVGACILLHLLSEQQPATAAGAASTYPWAAPTTAAAFSPTFQHTGVKGDVEAGMATQHSISHPRSLTPPMVATGVPAYAAPLQEVSSGKSYPPLPMPVKHYTSHRQAQPQTPALQGDVTANVPRTSDDQISTATVSRSSTDTDTDSGCHQVVVTTPFSLGPGQVCIMPPPTLPVRHTTQTQPMDSPQPSVHMVPAHAMPPTAAVQHAAIVPLVLTPSPFVSAAPRTLPVPAPAPSPTPTPAPTTAPTAAPAAATQADRTTAATTDNRPAPSRPTAATTDNRPATSRPTAATTDNRPATSAPVRLASVRGLNSLAERMKGMGGSR